MPVFQFPADKESIDNFYHCFGIDFIRMLNFFDGGHLAAFVEVIKLIQAAQPAGFISELASFILSELEYKVALLGVAA